MKACLQRRRAAHGMKVAGWPLLGFTAVASAMWWYADPATAAQLVNLWVLCG